MNVFSSDLQGAKNHCQPLQISSNQTVGLGMEMSEYTNEMAAQPV